MNVYSMEDWTRDGSFKAQDGQPISSDVYEQFYNVMPPQSLPRADFPVSVAAGFMTTEPYTHANVNGKAKAFYMAFGSSGNDYYYLGLYSVTGDAHRDAQPLPYV